MNKKFMYSFAFLFAFALVSAGVVSFLSEDAIAKVTVTSPMEIGFIDSTDNAVDDLELEEVTALSTFEFEFEVSNLANNEIIAPNLVMIVSSNGEGYVTCEDLASIKFTDTWCHGYNSNDCPEQDIVTFDVCDDATGDAVYTIPTEKYKVGQTTRYPVSATWANVEQANYDISAQMNI